MVMKLNKMVFGDKKIEEAAQGAADLYEQDLPIMSFKITTQAGISMLRFREAEPIYLEYVHELQHFLFGLGIKNEMEV